MMTAAQQRAIMDHVAINMMPGWIVRYIAKFKAESYLQVQCYSCTDGTLQWSGRKWRLSYHMTATELVNTAFKAYLAALEHEYREQFLYRGTAIYNPHRDVDALVELRGRIDVRNNSMQGA